MEIQDKIVQFDKYCPTCKHFKKDEAEMPCLLCLNEPGGIGQRRPAHYENERK